MFRAVIAVILVGIAVGSGFAAYTVGVAVRHGQIMIPFETIQAAATAAFFALLVGVVSRTSKLRERIEIDHLLTTVSAGGVVLGVALAVGSQIAIPISLVVVGVAVGFGLGVGSLAGILTIIIAVAGLFALAVVFSVGVSFLIELLTTRSPRFRRYKNALIVVVFFALAFGYAVVIGGTVSIDPLFGGVGVAPPTWFVDLGLFGVPAVRASLLRGVGALGICVIGAPLLVVVATALATRVWETEPISATVLHHSRSLVGEGFAEQLLGGRVSRPVLTVARKRWLQERRVPISLMMTSYLLFLFVPVSLPIGVAGEIPGISIMCLVYIFGAGTGLAVGLRVISTEYSSLSMTLTTVSGEEFIRGEILAGVGVSVPVSAVITAVFVVASPVGALETVLFVVADVALCLCGGALALAVGMGVSYRKLIPVPVPFISTPVYGEVGSAGFIRMGVLLGLLALVCVPAFGGYILAFLGTTTVFGIQIATIRVGLLLITIIIAIGVLRITHQHAVRLYDDYVIP